MCIITRAAEKKFKICLQICSENWRILPKKLLNSVPNFEISVKSARIDSSRCFQQKQIFSSSNHHNTVVIYKIAIETLRKKSLSITNESHFHHILLLFFFCFGSFQMLPDYQFFYLELHRRKTQAKFFSSTFAILEHRKSSSMSCFTHTKFRSIEFQYRIILYYVW